MTMKIQGPEWLRPSEAAAALGVSTKTIAVWAREGKFPDGTVTQRPGGSRIYRRAVIEQLLNRGAS